MTMLPLSIPTLLLLLSLGNFTILVVLLVSTNAFSIKRSYYSVVAGKVFQGCSWALLALRGNIPIVYSAYIGSFALVIGLSLEAHGLISIEDYKRKRAHYYAIVSILFIVFFCVLAKTANQYVAVSSLFVSLVFLSVSVHILQVADITKTRMLISAMYALTACILIVRGIAAVSDPGFSLFSDNRIQEMTFGSTYVLLLLSGSGFILLKKERVDRMLSESMKELENLARVDSLTGLMNRRFLDEYLTFSIPENRRRHEPIAVIMIDIDYFKNYNDLYGHVAGDACLAAVAKEIRRHCLRVTDLAARFGGEEFTVLMWNMNEAQSLSIAETIRAGIENLGIEHSDSEAAEVVTVSLGVYSAVPENDSNTVAWYLNQADTYLYHAKRTGRNKCISASTAGF